LLGSGLEIWARLNKFLPPWTTDIGEKCQPPE
jgi:hypothetical protein